VIDSLLKAGAEVIYKKYGIHVSGHGSQEDLRTMLTLIRPRFFIPVHGQYHQMHAHTKIAQATGLPPENTIIVENGTVVSLTKDRLSIVGKVPAEAVMIDGKNVGDIEPSVIEERKKLSKEGVVNAVILINSVKRTMQIDPIIETKGLISSKFSSKIFNLVKAGIEEMVGKWTKQKGTTEDLEIMIKGFIGSMISSEIHRSPVIFVTVLSDK
jgi:ribonuclease J